MSIPGGRVGKLLLAGAGLFAAVGSQGCIDSPYYNYRTPYYYQPTPYYYNYNSYHCWGGPEEQPNGQMTQEQNEVGQERIDIFDGFERTEME